MILNFKGISVTKEDVVIDYYGSLVNEGGETLKIHKQLCEFLNKDIDKDSFYNNEGFKCEVKRKVIKCLNTGVVLYERFKVGGHVLVIESYNNELFTVVDPAGGVRYKANYKQLTDVRSCTFMYVY